MKKKVLAKKAKGSRTKKALAARGLLSKKKTSTREKKNTKAVQPMVAKPNSFNLIELDPVHSPGHRKMNLKSKFDEARGVKLSSQNVSTIKNIAASNRVQRIFTRNRRVITGATLGKTGRITIKV